jgi:hypothetical protein
MKRKKYACITAVIRKALEERFTNIVAVFVKGATDEWFWVTDTFLPAMKLAIRKAATDFAEAVAGWKAYQDPDHYCSKLRKPYWFRGLMFRLVSPCTIEVHKLTVRSRDGSVIRIQTKFRKEKYEWTVDVADYAL